MEEILSATQVAELLQVDPNTIYGWARSEKIRASKIGKQWYVLRTDVDAFLQNRKAKPSFLSEIQMAELVTALKGRREIPQKFAYLADGADLWAKYCNISEYDIRLKETKLLEENSKKIFSAVKQEHCNLLDLGCGDGKKANLVLKEFGVEKAASGYFPLDISTRMIELAIKENADLLARNRVIETFNEDFERGSIASATYYLRRRYHKNNFILFLGTTLGNCSDAHRILVNLRDGMSVEDRLLVGVALYNGKPKIAPYESKEAYDQLWQLPQKIGVKKSDAYIKVEFNEKLKQFEDYMHFRKNASIELAGEKIIFRKGEKILMDISKRFTQKELVVLFHGARLKINSFFVSKEKDYALVMCRPFR